MLHQTVHAFIEKHRLLSKGGKVIVALSGGADSVALIDILHRLGYFCIGAHVNFHLRDEESDRDAAFSQQLCQDFGIPFYKSDLYAEKYAEENDLSIEMAARELRYRWFEQLRLEQNAQAVAVAHHRDDSIETALLNLIRGTGIRGLTGIKPRNGKVVRPMLCCNREDILEYIEQRSLTFVIDRTNMLNEYRRNKIRNEVLPLLESIQPSVRESISRTMDHLADTEVLYEQALVSAKKRVCTDWKTGMDCDLCIQISALELESTPQSILYELISPYGFGRMDVKQIWKNRLNGSGKCYYSNAHRLVCDRDHFLVTEIPILEAAEYLVDETQSAIMYPIHLTFKMLKNDPTLVLSASKSVAYLDADKLLFPLLLRHPKNGDAFVPFGMHGHKRISDFCTDLKMSLPEKENIWLLCSGKDVVWVVGERIDNRFRVQKETKRICQLTVEWES